MTALATLWRFDGRPDAANGCARMLAAQELYGRHGGAQWSTGSIALGRRLMQVLPESLAEKELSDFSPLWFLRGLRFYEGPQHVLD